MLISYYQIKKRTAMTAAFFRCCCRLVDFDKKRNVAKNNLIHLTESEEKWKTAPMLWADNRHINLPT